MDFIEDEALTKFGPMFFDDISYNFLETVDYYFISIRMINYSTLSFEKKWKIFFQVTFG